MANIITSCDFLFFYSFLLRVQKLEYTAKGPVRVISTIIGKCIATFLQSFPFAKINSIKKSEQSSKIRLFSIRGSNSIHKHTVGIRVLFLLNLIIYQLAISLFYAHESLLRTIISAGSVGFGHRM
jgi:hypothetical protein